MSKELDRLQLHRRILADKLAVPSNPATVRVLQEHLDRVDLRIRRLNGEKVEKPDPLDRMIRLDNVARGIRTYRSRNRKWLREARFFGDQDREQFLLGRIDHLNDRLRNIKDEQELDPAVRRKLRREPTAEDAKRGILVCIKYARISFENAVQRGDGPAVKEIGDRIGRLEAMIAALPGVPV